MKLLTNLKGVGVPVASAILTIIDPQHYGVIDIRVWQTLYTYSLMDTKSSGRGFNIKDWEIYILKLRELARKFQVSVRDIEISLFFYHDKLQEGTLYK